MVKKKSFDRGDIIHIDLDLTKGKEQQGKRYTLILSPKAFNETGLAFVAPVTQRGDYSRHRGFAVTLTGTGTKTQGAVLVNMIKSLDLSARNAKKIESAPNEVVVDAMFRLQAILEG